ncbi:MAG TPA: MAB_1171c family putative transporter [Actinoplanes sp.]|nr:MAB_1171c family putative transporter [Actinoplanes sp.]
MDTVLYVACAATGWLTFGYILRLQRLRPSPARRAVTVTFGAFAAGITLAIPPLAAAVDGLTGMPNLAKVLSHGCVMAIVVGSESWLLFLALPPEQAGRRTLRWILATAGAYLAMLGLFGYTLLAGSPVRLTVEYARDPMVTAYLLLFLVVGFFASFIDISRLCWQYARTCGRTWLRRGLRTTAVGAAFALLYALNKILYLLAYWSGSQPEGERQIAAVLVTLSALLMSIGLTMPAWGPRLPRWSDLRSYRRLTPLWHDLVTELPHIELDPALRRARTAIRDIDYALIRRLAEIRDARLALRPFMDARVTAVAEQHAGRAGLTGEDCRATVEAAQLAYAIRMHRAGNVTDNPQPADTLHLPGDGYVGEVAWLVKVAGAYARSEVVVRTLASVPVPTHPDLGRNRS